MGDIKKLKRESREQKKKRQTEREIVLILNFFYLFLNV